MNNKINRYNRVVNIIKFELEDFLKFLNLFQKFLILKGKKTKALNYFDNILFNLKLLLKKNNIKKDLYVFLYDVINILYPIMGLTFKKVGQRVDIIPAMISNRMQIILVLKWLVKDLKGKSRLRGVNIIDVINNLYLTFKKQSIAYSSKKKYISLAVSNRYMIGRKRKKQLRKINSSYLGFYDW